MRIIHTSDWHLGQYFFGKSRAAEHKQFLTWLIEQVKAHQVDAIVVAGDIFDTGNPPSYARELYFDFIAKLQALDVSCQLVVLAGNHDSAAMMAESKQLLAKFATFVIPTTLVAEAEQVFALNNKAGQPGAVICAVPFIRPREMVVSKAGQSAHDKQSQLQYAIAEHYQRLYRQAQTLAEQHSEKPLPIIATGHLTTVGASVSDSVREIYIGTLDAFPASAFPPVDYLALGHIHQMQNIAKSAHIRYSGSPIPLSFDEAKQDKVVLLVDVIKDQPPVIEPLTIPRFQAMAMIKTRVENVVAEIEQLIANAQNHTNHRQKVEMDKTEQEPHSAIWLDIEIETTEYRSDIQAKITEQLKPYLTQQLVEILLIRRSKSQRQQLLEQQEKITLEELTPLDVFQERLKLLALPDEPVGETTNAEHKNKLTELFTQALSEVEEAQKAKQQIPEPPIVSQLIQPANHEAEQ
ncbi:MAG: exonuclease subunit SbcD [Thalassotalea sp.]